MANFKVGDEVMCVDSKDIGVPSTFGTELIAGQKYLVLDIRNNPCCGALTLDVGVKVKAAFIACGCGQKLPPNPYKYAWRFIKLDGLQETQDERTEQEA